jgi:hypothetical protein
LKPVGRDPLIDLGRRGGKEFQHRFEGRTAERRHLGIHFRYVDMAVDVDRERSMAALHGGGATETRFGRMGPTTKQSDRHENSLESRFDILSTLDFCIANNRP